MADNVEFKQQSGPRLLVLVLYVLAALLIAILIVLGSRWVYHKVHKNSSTSTTQTTKNPTSLKDNKSKSNPATSDTGNNKKPTDKTSNKSSNSRTELSDTGPGSVVAIFSAVSIAAAGLHYMYKLRKAST